jgi:hypothetical protein
MLFMQIWELRKIAMLSKLKCKLMSDESKEKSTGGLVIASLNPLSLSLNYQLVGIQLGSKTPNI